MKKFEYQDLVQFILETVSMQETLKKTQRFIFLVRNSFESLILEKFEDFSKREERKWLRFDGSIGVRTFETSKSNF